MKTTTKSLGCLPSARPTDLAFGFCLSKASFRSEAGFTPASERVCASTKRATAKESSAFACQKPALGVPWGLAPGDKTTAVRSTKAVDKGSSFRSEAGFQSASGEKATFARKAQRKGA